MKKTLTCAVVGGALLVGGCTRVGPGYVGIKVNMAGSNKGVQDYPALTGWVFYNPFSEDVFEYPTFVQSAVWTHNLNEGRAVNEEITFTTVDKMQVAADISLGYHLDGGKVPAFYVKFRNDNVEDFTHGFLRNMARQVFDDVAGKYNIDQIMGDNGPFLKEVRSTLQAEIRTYGVELDQFGFIGAPRPPKEIVDGINLSVQANVKAKQAQNELAEVTAQMAKEREKADTYARNVLVQAEARAEGNRKEAASLTPVLVDYIKANKWNGQLPQVTGSGGTLIDLTK